MGKQVPIPDRVWGKVRIAPDGCWNYIGSKDSKGYGVVWMGRKDGRRSSAIFARAHRLAYELTYGEIPDGLHIHHLCGNKVCVKPEHLEAVEQGVHNLVHQSHEHGASFHRSKTHCKHGHLFSEENTYYAPNGQRTCRTCRYAAQQRWKERRVSSRV